MTAYFLILYRPLGRHSPKLLGPEGHLWRCFSLCVCLAARLMLVQQERSMVLKGLLVTGEEPIMTLSIQALGSKGYDRGPCKC